MTVLEASNRLVDFFIRNDYFHFETDFKKVCLVSDTDADQAAVLIALQQLAQEKFVVPQTVKNQEFWVLFKPLAFHTQDLQISVMTAVALAETVNNFVTGDENKVNPLRISESDILNLITVAKGG